METTPTYLDTLPLLNAQVGYGDLGLHGSLGYEDKSVVVESQDYGHALSTHPPACLRFDLGKRFASFHCQVALNDDVPAGFSHADFTVLADGRQVAAAHHVVAGESPRSLSADIFGARTLELVVRTSRWEYCHAVWLGPCVSEVRVEMLPGMKEYSDYIEVKGRINTNTLVATDYTGYCVSVMNKSNFSIRNIRISAELYDYGGKKVERFLTLVPRHGYIDHLEPHETKEEWFAILANDADRGKYEIKLKYLFDLGFPLEDCEVVSFQVGRD